MHSTPQPVVASPKSNRRGRLGVKGGSPPPPRLVSGQERAGRGDVGKAEAGFEGQIPQEQRSSLARRGLPDRAPRGCLASVPAKRAVGFRRIWAASRLLQQQRKPCGAAALWGHSGGGWVPWSPPLLVVQTLQQGSMFPAAGPGAKHPEKSQPTWCFCSEFNLAAL